MSTQKRNDIAAFLALLDYFANNIDHVFSLQEISATTQIPPRTVQRYIKKFRECGFEINSEAGHGGGYHIPKSAQVFRKLSMPELLAIMFAFQTFDSLYKLPFDGIDVPQVSARLFADAPHSVQENFTKLESVVQFSLSERKLATPELQKLSQAALAKRMLDIHYTSSSGSRERTITPLGIYMLDGVWYCPAYCHARQQELLFRADRIHVRSLGPIDHQHHSTLSQWRQIYNETNNTVQLTAQLTPPGCIRAQAIPWMDGHVDADGYLQVMINPQKLPNIYEDLLSFGPELTILAPQSMQTELLAKLQATLANYHR